jgi:hypothetical protein
MVASSFDGGGEKEYRRLSLAESNLFISKAKKTTLEIKYLHQN